MSEKTLLDKVNAACAFGCPPEAANEIMAELVQLWNMDPTHPRVAEFQKEQYNRGFANAEDQFKDWDELYAADQKAEAAATEARQLHHGLTVIWQNYRDAPASHRPTREEIIKAVGALLGEED